MGHSCDLSRSLLSCYDMPLKGFTQSGTSRQCRPLVLLSAPYPQLLPTDRRTHYIGMYVKRSKFWSRQVLRYLYASNCLDYFRFSCLFFGCFKPSLILFSYHSPILSLASEDGVDSGIRIMDLVWDCDRYRSAELEYLSIQ